MPLRLKFFFAVLFCAVLTSFLNAQEDTQIQEPVDGLRLHVFKPVPFGNNVLGSGHRPGNIGLEGSISLPLVPSLIEVGLGYQLTAFDKADERIFANSVRTTQHLFFAQLQYSFFKHNAWRMEVNLGGGINNLNPTDGAIKSTWGSSAKTGVSGFYRVSRVISFYATTQYIMGFNSISAPSEFNSYFNRTHQIQFGTGIFIN